MSGFPAEGQPEGQHQHTDMPEPTLAPEPTVGFEGGEQRRKVEPK
jgi:hypothetical protein